jgi:membrane associated rhomboid family serine protease
MIGAMILLFLFLLYIVITLFLNSIIFPTPISDTGVVRYKTVPWMTGLIIVINSFVFVFFQASNLYQSSQNASTNINLALHQIYDYYAQIQSFGYRGLVIRQAVGAGAFVTFTSMFMHGDMWHWMGNMIYLWSFGRRVEDSCGPWRYLVFYLFAGMVANVGSDVLNRAQADIPGIGASGAIAGVMGAYLILFPGALVTCFWGIGIALRLPIVLVMKAAGIGNTAEAPVWRWTIRLPAWILLIFFLVMNTLPSIDVIGQGKSAGGTNTLAHVTGFLAALLIFLFVRKDVLTRYIAGRSL